MMIADTESAASRVIRWVCILLATATALAAEPVEIMETWTEGGTAGWQSDASEVVIANPGGHLNAAFNSQSYPRPLSCIVGRSIEPGILITNLAFRLHARQRTPSAVQVCLHGAGGNWWTFSVAIPATTGWTVYDVPVAYAAGWSMGPCGSDTRFLADMRSVDYVGICVVRSGTCAAHDLSIDDFRISGTVLDPEDPNLDLDEDGMSDVWEAKHDLNPNDRSDAELDSDSDGMANESEFCAGTDPNDAGSVFRITGMSVSGNSITVQWMGGTNVTCHLECCDVGHGNEWRRVSTNRPAVSPTAATHMTTARRGIYRVVVSRSESD